MKHLSILSKHVFLYATFAFFSSLIHSCNTLQSQENINGKITGAADSSAVNPDKAENSDEEEGDDESYQDDQPLGQNDQD